jgi:hypothetical protein
VNITSIAASVFDPSGAFAIAFCSMLFVTEFIVAAAALPVS